MPSFNSLISKITSSKKNIAITVAVAVIFTATIVILAFYGRGPTEAYSFVQDGWMGGESSIPAVHEFNQRGWSHFESKDDSVLATHNLTLGLVHGYKSDSSYDDFNKGINDNTSVEGIGEEGEVILEIFDVFEIGNVVSISTGTAHTCAVSDAGYTYCWGRGNHGQLGNDSREDSLTPVRVHAGRASAIDSDGGYLTNIKSVSVGNDHSCAVARSGNVYCWGYGEYGQNGNNTNSNEHTPVRVHEGEAVSSDSDGGYLSNARSVSAGSEHTCAVSNDNNVYCWGEGANGRLGNNEDNSQFIPTRVRGGKALASDTKDGYLSNIRSVSAGNEHTCAVSVASNAYCWGHRERLGNEMTEDSLIPERILAGEAVMSDKTGTHLSNISTISAGNLHTCAVSNAGNPYCWGYGQYGQLGNDSTANQRVPVLVRADSRQTPREDFRRDRDLFYFSNIRSISAGHLHTCAVSNDNNIYCWGYGQFGQLGNNSTANRSLPVRVEAGESVFADKSDSFLSNMDIVSPGYRQTCGVSRANHVYCWGHGYYGQLGNNNKRNYHTPVRPRKHDFGLFFVVAKYSFSGEFTSREIDTGQKNIRFTNLEFLTTKRREVDVKLQIRSAKTEDGLYEADWYGPTGLDDYYKTTDLKINSVHDGDRWVQYKIFLETTNDSFTPIVRSVGIGYEFYPAIASLTSSPYNLGKPTYLTGIRWFEDDLEETFVKFQIRTAKDDRGEPKEWNSWVGPDGTEDTFFEEFIETQEPLNFNERNIEWFQYKAFLGSIDGISSPVLESIEILYMQ